MGGDAILEDLCLEAGALLFTFIFLVLMGERSREYINLAVARIDLRRFCLIKTMSLTEGDEISFLLAVFLT
jgi:hypothetical protein